MAGSNFSSTSDFDTTNLQHLQDDYTIINLLAYWFNHAVGPADGIHPYVHTISEIAPPIFDEQIGLAVFLTTPSPPSTIKQAVLTSPISPPWQTSNIDLWIVVHQLCRLWKWWHLVDQQIYNLHDQCNDFHKDIGKLCRKIWHLDLDEHVTWAISSTDDSPLDLDWTSTWMSLNEEGKSQSICVHLEIYD